MNTRSCTRLSALEFASVLSLLVVLALSPACSPPDGLSSESTDLFLVEMWSDGGLMRLGNPTNLTHRPGYDNQPRYSPDGRAVLYVSRDGLKSDVYRYDLETERITQLTSTGDREYSPEVLPQAGGFSAIRAERDSRRRIWVYPEDGSRPRPVWTQIERPMLYYAWADATTAAIVMEEGSGTRALYALEVGREAAERQVTDVGRSLNRIPGRHAVSFVHKATPAEWWIEEIDFDTGEVRRIARTLQGAEDHAWTPGGAIVMGVGSEVYLREPGANETWRSIADYSTAGLRHITRIAVSPSGDSMILVAESAAD